MARFVGFLRGINVGGRNKLSMKRLIQVFHDCGAQAVATYIQSGNVRFSASNQAESVLVARRVERRLAEEDHVESLVVLRTPRAIQGLIETHPFVADEEDERFVSVGFFSKTPSADAVARLDKDRSPPDRFVVRRADLFLHTPQGMGRSKLTVGYFDVQLGVVTTVRNLKTLRAIVALEG